MSRFDKFVNFAKLSEEQASWAHKILDEAEAEICFVLKDCRNRMKKEKLHLLDGIEEDIDKAFVKFLKDRNYDRRPYDFFDEIKDGHRLVFTLNAEDSIDICKHYLAPKLKREQA